MTYNLDLTEGLIPAHAGKTPPRCPGGPRTRAHPRSRGENHPLLQEQDGVRGSSPLTRGKRHPVVLLAEHGRLIPAHAGKTRRGWHPRAGSRAHPRSRGENRVQHTTHCYTRGSSPLTRGKPLRVRPARKREGLIPAHAGKTGRVLVASDKLGAHPRSRGENPGLTAPMVNSVGSSPLTRGKPIPGAPGCAPGWLIPAHAGKTPRRAGRVDQRRAHPRSRGENRPSRTSRPTRPGSSPLTRGKHRYPGRREHDSRLIPAHAGKTRMRVPELVVCQAHPRSRGENMSTAQVPGT